MSCIINLFRIKILGNRVFGLDLLRCGAILLVLSVHFVESITPNEVTKFYFTYLHVDGVGLFFVLSGFLIGTILIKDFLKYGISFSTLLNFWKRRWFRTLPNYYLVLLSVLGFNYFYKKIDLSFYDILKRVTFTQNLYSLDENYYKKFPEGWSLAVEEWFYLAFPLLIVFFFYLIKKTATYIHTYIRAAFWISVFVILFGVSLFRYYQEFILKEVISAHLLLNRLDGISFGVIGALLAYFHGDIWKKLRYPGVFVSIILFFINKFCVEWKSVSLLLDSFVVLSLLPFLSNFKIQRHNFITRIITWISLISYSLYLLNLFILDNMINPFTHLYMQKNSIKLFIFILFSCLFSTILYKNVEVPVMKWRDKITKK